MRKKNFFKTEQYTQIFESHVVPYALKQRIEIELERMVKSGWYFRTRRIFRINKNLW